MAQPWLDRLPQTIKLGDGALLAIKAFHSVWFLSVAAALFHVLDVGIRGRPTRATVPAYILAITQSGLFALNHGHCPLTDAVAKVSSEDARVSDLFLPLWLADRLPRAVAAQLLVGVVGLGARHAGTLVRRS